MDPPPSSGAGSGTSGTYTSEAAETLRFEEEIHSLMRDNLIDQGIESPPRSGGDNSFTALLGLAPNQAVELLHGPEPAAAGPEMWREKALRVPLDCSPTFPTNAALVERAARFSVYAAEEDDACGISPANPKVEPEEYSDLPMYAIHGEETQKKRKEGDRIKVKNGGAKKTKSAEEDTGGEKLPYVHVRARRGQATDSHSLAERARREKINARMKLLQELVPGCSKITGTALVLDEIINHVQFLQRRVEILSMSLAAVNPRIDYGGLDSFFAAAECGPVTAMMNGRSRMSLEQQISWLEGPAMAGDGVRRQPAWQVDAVQQQEGQMWERRDDATPHAFLAPTAASLFSYDSAISVSLPNQLKTEL